MRRLFNILFLFLIAFGQVKSIEEKQFRSFDSEPYLTPTSSPTTSVFINWNTKDLKPSIIAYGRTLALNDTIKLSRLTNYHHIILNNLSPDTRYYYKILPGQRIYSFKTAPIFSESFNFIVFGDTRTDSTAHQAVIERMVNYDFEFLIHSGDLVTSGYYSDEWRKFFNIETKIISQKLFLPTIGNHEKPFYQYDTLFSLPGIEDFYSFRYANTVIICLNTEMELGGYQKKWLINELSFYRSDTSVHWIFVNLHRPPYSSGSHGSEIKVREVWSPIFENYNVDIVFCGHDHSYERTKKINGVIYIICAGGGAPLYDVGRNEWTEYSEKTYHFCLIKIKNKELLLKAIKPDGTVFDSLLLRK
uniref:Metallophosphoesterase family protein n=1 Tax=candidate division WOR-3 bacterium TaxID=2052148 RepID=A0A7C4TBF3_UNCW3